MRQSGQRLTQINTDSLMGMILPWSNPPLTQVIDSSFPAFASLKIICVDLCSSVAKISIVNGIESCVDAAFLPCSISLATRFPAFCH
jgi:hypothetical protein